MARAIWTGAISFGLVNVPVKLYSATSPKSVRFHQLAKQTGARIKQQRIDESTGKSVPYDDIVKGYELAPDRYVVIDPAELEAFMPEATHTVDIEEFVELDEIDPIYYDHTYYLAPSGAGSQGAAKAAAKAYRLLLDAMVASGKVGIGRVVLRSKQQLCALRPMGDVLALSTMLYGDEVVRADNLDELDLVPAAGQTSDRELEMAQALIDGLVGEFDPSAFKDEYREHVLELIEAKAAGQPLEEAPKAAPEDQQAAPDLMAALEASLNAMRNRKQPKAGETDGGSAKAGTTKTRAAKSRSTKTATAKATAANSRTMKSTASKNAAADGAGTKTPAAKARTTKAKTPATKPKAAASSRKQS